MYGIAFATSLYFCLLFTANLQGIAKLQSSIPNITTRQLRDVKDIKVDVRVLDFKANEYQLQITTYNTGKEAVYLMTDPVQALGVKGPYIALDEDDSSKLKISIKVYPPPCFFNIPKNSASVKLIRLESGASHSEKISVKFPVLETMPPYGITARRNEITLQNIKSITVSVGVLPDEEGVRELLRMKSFGPLVNGLERLTSGSFKGSYLIEIQRSISSSNVIL